MLAGDWVRRRIALELERGVQGRAARWASRAWRAFADPVRPVALPPEARVIGIGGATLGGSGKTPLAQALALALCPRARVAVAANAYPVRPQRAMQVLPDAEAHTVGDEPLALARALDAHGVPVVIAPNRRGALDLAARLAPLVVADGLLQTRPRRLALSVLALDARAPWGAGACPPAGDLRADASRLLAAADVILLGAASEKARFRVPEGREVLVWQSSLVGARTADGELIPVARLATLRLGVTLAIARPERVLAELAEHRVRPAVVRLAPDHALPRAGRARDGRFDAWLTTAKCRTKLPRELGGVPVWALEHRVELPSALIERCLRNR